MVSFQEKGTIFAVNSKWFDDFSWTFYGLSKVDGNKAEFTLSFTTNVPINIWIIRLC